MKISQLTLPFVALSFALLMACEHPCLTLAKKVCECESVASEVEDCKSRVTSEKNSIGITDSDKALCESKLDTCTCDGLNTPMGQARCGMANEPKTAGSDASDSSATN